MRVLVLIHEYPPVGGGGGVVAANVAREIVRRGHEVTVLTTGMETEASEDVVDGVRVVRMPGRRRGALDNKVSSNALTYLRKGRRFAREIVDRERPDVIHAHFALPAGVLGARLAKSLGAPLVLTMHGSDVPGYSTDEFRLRLALLKPIIRWVWRRSDRLVAVSGGLRDLATTFAPATKVAVIHNAIDTARFTPPDVPRSHGGPLRLVCVSRLVKRKGIQNLLAALPGLGAVLPYRLEIAGDGKYAEALRQQAADLGLTDVSFLGTRTQDELVTTYGDAELFVLPSLTEAFGMTFGEAMACGMPVIGTTVGGIPEVVRDGVDGRLVTPGDPDAIREAIVEMAARRGEFDAVGRAARERMESEFSWSSVADRYVRLFEEIRTARPTST